MKRGARDGLVLAGWTVALLGVIAVLQRANPGPAPDGMEPVATAFAGLRIAGLVVAWYLVAITVLGAAARAVRARRWMGAIDRITVGWLRALLTRAVGTGLAASLAVPAVAAGAQPVAPPPVETVTMRQVSPSPGPPPVVYALPPPQVPAGASTWRVTPGQCFWTIADAVLARARGVPATDEEIVPYWLRLIAANRDRLVDRENPDLIFPDQVFVVPPV